MHGMLGAWHAGESCYDTIVMIAQCRQRGNVGRKFPPTDAVTRLVIHSRSRTSCGEARKKHTEARRNLIPHSITAAD